MDQIYKGTEEDRMEPYYYSKMNKVQQAAYHAIRQGLLEISDSIQIPGMEAEELYNVFFRLRLDHPEIFWATGYKYRFYQDSPNLLFLPDYLFEKSKIREHPEPPLRIGCRNKDSRVQSEPRTCHCLLTALMTPTSSKRKSQSRK